MRTLHHYDRLGLVRPTGRTESGHRLYEEKDLLHLQQVLALRYLGFSLEQIGRLLARPDYDVVAALEAQRDVLQERITQLQGMAATLDRLLSRLGDSGSFDPRLVARATKDASKVLAQRGSRMNEEQMLRRFEELGQHRRGKVREIYDLGDGRLLIVTTDRISAFDVILPTSIPDKGAVLTQMAAFWFDLTAGVAPNHFIRVADGTPADELPFDLPPDLRGRSSIVKKAQRLDVECIVRGYLTGSAWAEYQQTGCVGGMRLAPGMTEFEQFPEPLFTPTSKAAAGHDENMSYDEVVELVGPEVADTIRQRTLAIYQYAQQHALQRGIIIADTKLEFGLLDGEPIVIDEMLTPDSSRFWPVDEDRTGLPKNALDKQFVRNWLTESGWDREPPAPELPTDLVEMTRDRYHEAFRRLTGLELKRYE